MTKAQSAAEVSKSVVERLVISRPTGRADKYSLNLWKFLKKHGPHFWGAYFTMWNCVTGELDVFYDKKKSQAPNIYIGLLDEDGYLMGAQLSQILCNGAKTRTFAHPPKKMFQEMPLFWQEYEKHGKCAIDPEHWMYADKDRYEPTTGVTLRTCKWCGLVQRKVETARTVIDVTWESACGI